MKLKCIATGSSGNCYTLTSDSGETLILDCGIPLMKIKEGLNWNIKDVAGYVVTHAHSDHSRALNDLKDMRIPVFAPYISLKPMRMGKKFKIQAFDLTTVDGRWTHTNADGSECPCYGFLITHPDMGRMIYATDTELIKWRFKDVNHILLGVNYDKDLVDKDNDPKTRHVFRGHMSIDTACDFVKANYSDNLQNVIMCHLSSENADKDLFIEKMKKVAYRANVDVAEPGKEWILKKGDECPF